MGIGTASAQDDDTRVFNHLGAYAGFGTEGISFGVATTITPYLELSAGANIFPSIKIDGDVDLNATSIQVPTSTGFETYNLESINLKADLARTMFDLKLSAYPFGGNSLFFVAAGLSMGGKEIAKLTGHSDDVARLYHDYPSYSGSIAAVVDKYSIDIDKQGNAKGDIRVKSVRPYLGIGVGRMVPRHRVGFRFEAGCHFMGKPKVYQNDKEVDYSSALKEGDDDISKIVDKLTVYPVLKFTLTGRIF
mgnify:CR=1 FL=1